MDSQRADEYRTRADEAEQQAAIMRDERARQLLLSIAETYRRMAVETQSIKQMRADLESHRQSRTAAGDHSADLPGVKAACHPAGVDLPKQLREIAAETQALAATTPDKTRRLKLLGIALRLAQMAQRIERERVGAAGTA